MLSTFHYRYQAGKDEEGRGLARKQRLFCHDFRQLDDKVERLTRRQVHVGQAEEGAMEFRIDCLTLKGKVIF
ncbi:hypothetical protein NPIL_618971, partial [Nephila pilipes]